LQKKGGIGMAQMTRKTEQKRKEKVIDIYTLSEKRLKQAKKETKKYLDMQSFDDWDWLMRTVPGFWR